VSCPHQMKSSRLCGFGRGHADAASHTARAVEGYWPTNRRPITRWLPALSFTALDAPQREGVAVRGWVGTGIEATPSKSPGCGSSAVCSVALDCRPLEQLLSNQSVGKRGRSFKGD
jgi:hypothetical protein